MNLDDLSEEHHKARSRFVRKLVQQPYDTNIRSSVYAKKPPLKIVQFWDRLDNLPEDVQECMATWKKVEEQGIERTLFGKQHARDFIFDNLGKRHLTAFDKCYHPAMQSDYFRLSYLFVKGGCYIDTDDVYSGVEIQHFFNDGLLKIQPLCYDKATSSMVSPLIFTKSGADNDSWIFYFNNNPLITSREHPIIERALTHATLLLERATTKQLPEIQSTTGPGNLSKSIFDIVSQNPEMAYTLSVLCNWENIAKSKWDLSYRNDSRNWRYSNCVKYQG